MSADEISQLRAENAELQLRNLLCCAQVKAMRETAEACALSAAFLGRFEKVYQDKISAVLELMAEAASKQPDVQRQFREVYEERLRMTFSWPRD